jgi:hypothetical protein
MVPAPVYRMLIPKPLSKKRLDWHLPEPTLSKRQLKSTWRIPPVPSSKRIFSPCLSPNLQRISLDRPSWGLGAGKHTPKRTQLLTLRRKNEYISILQQTMHLTQGTSQQTIHVKQAEIYFIVS